MLRNYFKIMFRNLLKRKTFSLINLLGLASGMAICLLLVLYIENELGYDDYQQRGDQIYRLAMERKYPGRSAFRGGIPQSIGQAVKKEFPEVVESTRVLDRGNGSSIIAGEKTFIEKAVIMADSNFFRVFTGVFLQGDINTALQAPGTVVVNETTAKKYFGMASNAMGKQITVDNFQKYTISGVCMDWPEKSHFQFNLLLTTAGIQGLNRNEWVYFGPKTYLLLNKNASATMLEAKLPLIVEKYVAAAIPGLFAESYEQFIKEGNGYRYFLQPLKKIHLYSEVEDDVRPGGSMRILIILGAIAAFILFLACINFINLSTALSVERAREVGIRKTFGSRKAELIWQFLSESIVFSTASMIISLLLVLLFIPQLNKISGSQLSFVYFLQLPRLLLIFGFSIVIGIIAGLYPAFVLSSFEPIIVLKGRLKSNPRGISLRNGLVIFQFSISVVLIICTIVINKQMQYVLGDQLGFKKDHIISVDLLYRLRNQAGDQRQAFVDEVSGISGIEALTRCTNLPGDDESGGGATWLTVGDNASRTQKMQQVDEKYAALFGLELKAGRFFSKAFTTDSLGVVLNERSVADFGLKNPIGARLICKEPGLNPGDGKTENIFTVIGVVKDFHFQSLHKTIAPLIFVNSNKFGWGSAGIQIKGDHFKTTIADIEKTWKRFDQKHDISFRFLDETVAAQYKAEETEQKLATIFSMLAIAIASIGLFGLAAYSTLQRKKEINIRKVLGATPGNIVLILSKDFLVLVAFAVVIAFPLAWWAMHQWLQNFAYRVTISWWIFLLSGSIAALIALLTISYQAIKTAVTNPVTSLRSE